MIPASVQNVSQDAAWTTTHTVLAVAAVLLLVLALSPYPARWFRRWQDARFVINEAEAFCRDEARRVK